MFTGIFVGNCEIKSERHQNRIIYVYIYHSNIERKYAELIKIVFTKYL